MVYARRTTWSRARRPTRTQACTGMPTSSSARRASRGPNIQGARRNIRSTDVDAPKPYAWKIAASACNGEPFCLEVPKGACPTGIENGSGRRLDLVPARASEPSTTTAPDPQHDRARRDPPLHGSGSLSVRPSSCRTEMEVNLLRNDRRAFQWRTQHQSVPTTRLEEVPKASGSAFQRADALGKEGALLQDVRGSSASPTPRCYAFGRTPTRSDRCRRR